MASPIIVVLESILEEERRTNALLEEIAGKVSLYPAAQAVCPVCNKQLSDYEGPYVRRSNGMLQHKHHKSEASLTL